MINIGVKNTVDPFNISRYSKKYIWTKCINNSEHPDYSVRASHFTNGSRCPYCAHRKIVKCESVGHTHPTSIKLWSDRNITTPYEHFYSSSDIIWWKCENGVHEEYQRSLNQSHDINFRCPECSRERNESYLQEKVRTYITNTYSYTLKHERSCSIVPRHPEYQNDGRYDMPFDNEIVELRCICEVHGRQHYDSNSFNGWWQKDELNPEGQLQKRKEYDEYKKQYALSHGFSYLEVPYWTEKNDQYKKLIDDKISEILAKIKIA